MPPPENLTIAEALSSLREQLEDAVERAQGTDLTFLCRNVEVRLQVTVTTTMKGSVRAGVWNVVTLGFGADRSRADVHDVKLVLEPQLKGSKDPVRVDDEE